MPHNLQEEVQDHAFEIIALRALIVQLFAEKLMQLESPRKGANLLVSRATAALGETLGKAEISEANQMKIIEHVVLILDDAAHAATREGPTQSQRS